MTLGLQALLLKGRWALCAENGLNFNTLAQDYRSQEEI